MKIFITQHAILSYIIFFSIFATVIAFAGGISPQLIITITFFFVSLAGFTPFRKIFKEKKGNRSNIIFSVVALVVSVSSFIHLRQLESEVEHIPNRLEIVETSNIYLISIGTGNFQFKKPSDIKFNKDNPLRAYYITKNDIFGYNVYKQIAFRSDLMDNYETVR